MQIAVSIPLKNLEPERPARVVVATWQLLFSILYDTDRLIGYGKYPSATSLGCPCISLSSECRPLVPSPSLFFISIIDSHLCGPRVSKADKTRVGNLGRLFSDRDLIAPTTPKSYSPQNIKNVIDPLFQCREKQTHLKR